MASIRDDSMKAPNTLTVIPKVGFKIPNGYGHVTSPKVREVKASRNWRIQARRILLSWSGADQVMVSFDDGSEDRITWDQVTSHHPNSPMGKFLAERGES